MTLNFVKFRLKQLLKEYRILVSCFLHKVYDVLDLADRCSFEINCLPRKDLLSELTT